MITKSHAKRSAYHHGLERSESQRSPKFQKRIVVAAPATKAASERSHPSGAHVLGAGRSSIVTRATRSSGSRACGRNRALEDAEVVARRESDVPPERGAVVVVGEEEDVALGNAQARELPEAPPEERPRDAAPPVARRDGEVMQVAAPPIVAAEDGTDQHVARSRDHAQGRVPLEERCDAVRGVRLAQADSRARLPESEYLGVVRGGHRVDLEVG